MAEAIPEDYADLIERPVVAALGTMMPSGDVQVHPVWADSVDGRLRINTARGRQKDKNLAAHPRCTLLFIDPDNPYRYLEVRGQVVDEREEGARSHIDALAGKYLGVDEYPYYGGETRVMYVVEPMRVTCMG